MYKDTILIDSEDEGDSIQKIIFPENCSLKPKEPVQKPPNGIMKNNIGGPNNSTYAKMIDESQESNNLNISHNYPWLYLEVANGQYKFPISDLEDW